MSSAPRRSVAPREPSVPAPNGGAELSFESLMASVARATHAVASARDSNSQVLSELTSVQELLQRGAQLQHELGQQLQGVLRERDRLAGELQQFKLDAQRERSFFLEEQDRFIAGVLEDHEEALDRVTRER